MDAVYNEIDPFACRWLDELIRNGHIASGRVEPRSIADLVAADVAGPGQRHFFAGIGVWSYALRLAGVPDDANIWTGSCPCQPFSDAGERGGFDDARHLWPHMFRLIRECRPAIVLGEQVASKAGLAWFDVVRADLEGAGYAVGAADLCAAGIGAPHIRQRLYFVAHTQEGRRGPWRTSEASGGARQSDRSRSACVVGDASGEGSWWDTGTVLGSQGEARWSVWRQPDVAEPASAARDPWRDVDWIPCTDGKSRPVEPGTFPLAHGAPVRVGRLRGYGNAIVAEAAATFIEAALEAIGEA